MKIINKITDAKTNTLVVLSIILSVFGILAMWTSSIVDLLIDSIFDWAVFSDMFNKYFRNLADGYTTWVVYVEPQVLVVLTIVQLLVITPLVCYMLVILNRRHKDGSAKSWQFLITLLFAILFAMFSVVTLDVLFFEFA